MDINTNSWHFKLYNIHESMPTRYYLDGDLTIDICKYFRIVMIAILLIGVVGFFVALLAFLFLIVLLEPILVLGNYMFGNGWEPIIGLWLGKESTDFGLAWAGVTIWTMGGGLGILAYLHKIGLIGRVTDGIKNGNGFRHVAYQRYVGWKEKHCTLIKFTDE